MLISVRVISLSLSMESNCRALFNPLPWSKNPIIPS